MLAGNKLDIAEGDIIEKSSNVYSLYSISTKKIKRELMQLKILF